MEPYKTSSYPKNQPKIFYGWYIVVAATILRIYNSLTFSYGFTSFVDPITTTHSWTYAQVSLATSLRGVESGVFNPFLGMAVDRWPVRRLMIIGICLMALGIYLISQSSSLTMFYLSFLVVGLGTSIAVMMVPRVVLARWFHRNLGKASGILATANVVGGLVAPVVVAMIDSFGWQTVLVFISIGVLGLGMPVSMLFRDRPEKYGFLPDGKVTVGIKSEATSDEGFTVREALNMRPFWYIGLPLMLQTTIVSAVSVHQMPYLTSIGFERSTSAIAITIFSVVSIGARLTSGFLADVFPKKYVLAMAMMLVGLGIFILQLADGSSFTMVILYAVIYGVGIGGSVPLKAPLMREYFGLKRFGSILGIMSFFTMFGSIIGAPLTGLVYDMRGSYYPMWFVYSGLIVGGLSLILALPRPAFGKPSSTTEEERSQ